MSNNYKNKITELNIKMVLMHRLILNFPSLNTDHINGNRLDNRRKNLRIATHIENAWNVTKLRSDNKSGIRGVCWSSAKKTYRANIYYYKKQICIGYFKDKKSAEIAYDFFMLMLFGKFAHTNQRRKKNETNQS